MAVGNEVLPRIRDGRRSSVSHGLKFLVPFSVLVSITRVISAFEPELRNDPMAHTRSQAEKLAETLRSLPPAQSGLRTKLAMVTYLRAEIIGLQERGFNMAAIAAALGAAGFAIAPSTLKGYLWRLRSRRNRRQVPPRRRAMTTRYLLN